MTRADAFARARAAVLGLWGLLLLVLAAWQLRGTPSPEGFVLLVVMAAPLLSALPGLWRGRRQTYRWAALTLAPTVAWSLTELLANPAARQLATLAVLLAFLALAAIVAALRAMPSGSA